MKLFLSTYINKLDKKGRVSIPAQFRNILSQSEHNQVISYKSFINNCVEVCSPDKMEQLYNYVEGLDPFSEEKDAFATAILGGSIYMSIDGEGRVVLPEEYIDFLSITENVLFVGKGSNFEIWQPELFKEYSNQSREIALKNRLSLRNISNISGDVNGK